MSKRSKACDISPQVKQIVWERDKHSCIFCGNTVNVMPNCHYISRHNGGLGIEENILTACTGFTPLNCHFNFDSGTEEVREVMEQQAREYLQSIYPEWDKSKLYYKKGMDL